MVSYPPAARAIGSIATLYLVRMLGLFMALPVLALYAPSYEGAAAMSIGFAIGVYGLTQGVMQIPLGLLSDRIGRMPVLLTGFALFGIGSVIAAMSTTIEGLIAGRALQGAGAVAGVLMALLADTTSDKVRTAAMAGVGASIGLAFAIAMVVAPILASGAGISSIFWVAAAGAGMSIILLLTWVPQPVQVQKGQHIQLDLFLKVLRMPNLILGYSGVFVVHFTLMALFVLVPGKLVNIANIEPSDHSWVYLKAMAAGFVGMIPILMIAERLKRFRTGIVISALILALGFYAVSMAGAQWLVAAVILYFVGFNALEALMPSYMSRQAPPEAKGTALSVFATCQFVGTFLGAITAGAVANSANGDWALLAVGAMPLAWAAVAAKLYKAV